MSSAIGRTISIDENDIYFEERGSGEPLLLQHGLTGTSGDWRHVFDLEALTVSYRVIAPDARGHGRSTHRKGAFTFRRFLGAP